MNVQWLRTLFDDAQTIRVPKAPTFQIGDIIYGKIEKINEDRTALVRVGSHTLTAELQSPVKEGGTYTFHVQKTFPLELKILQHTEKLKDEESVIRHFRLPMNEQTKALVRWMMDESFSFKKHDMALIRQWLQTGGEKEAQAVKWLFMHNLPLRDDVFRAFVTLQHDKPLYEQRLMLAVLIDRAHPKGTLATLSSYLRHMPTLSSFSPEHIQQLLEETMKQQDEWFVLLQKAAEEATGELKTEITSLLDRMKAYQFLSTNDHSLQHIFTQFPLLIGTHATDVTIQWRGKQRENGKMDTDYCRILFYLTMATLKETIVDVHIQQRIVHISIINDTPHVELYASALEPSLKEKLAEHGYTLSAVSVKPPMNKRSKRLPVEPFSYKGVDYRV
ncbi:hypothetical protein HNR43_000861 [Anoxybacillus mongoliensis]|uniref:Flagellar hook-length control protein FliK n=1 Tax=Anoxybacillus mongoliensis TaxID=452565 RepID=A0A7W8N8J7_9BACL|nr:hypothetical protein [Anoxybacillus mongoliensis]MBB5354902.1 hypothetical protein [Anoxybacillus mongoliensis]